MVSCRFVGGDCCEVGEREFDAVGQRAAFSEATFRDVVVGGAAFIIEEDFKKVGFTKEELAQHGSFGDRYDPPSSFCDKLFLAQEIFRETRKSLLADASMVESDFANAYE